MDYGAYPIRDLFDSPTHMSSTAPPLSSPCFTKWYTTSLSFERERDSSTSFDCRMLTMGSNAPHLVFNSE
jgi:hypothetical protein